MILWKRGAALVLLVMGIASMQGAPCCDREIPASGLSAVAMSCCEEQAEIRCCPSPDSQTAAVPFDASNRVRSASAIAAHDFLTPIVSSPSSPVEPLVPGGFSPRPLYRLHAQLLI